jgi:hypothetical protein
MFWCAAAEGRARDDQGRFQGRGLPAMAEDAALCTGTLIHHEYSVTRR